jgi:capsular exopolysaccharide synthesis family protein
MRDLADIGSGDPGTKTGADDAGLGSPWSDSPLEIAWQNRWLILLALGLCLGTAAFYLHKTIPLYKSESRLYVEQTGPRIIKELEEGVMTRATNYLYTQAELLKSTSILSAAVEKHDLARLRTFADTDNPVALVKKRLEATVGRKDNLLTVVFPSPHPIEAAQVVNAVVDEYVTYHADRKRSTSAEVLRILQAEKTHRGEELSRKLTALMDFRRTNLAVSFDTGHGNFVLQQMERLSNLLTEARATAVESALFYESVQTLTTNPVALSQLVESRRTTGPNLDFTRERAQLQSRLTDLQTRLADRTRQLTPDHPGVTALRGEIEQVQAKLADLDTQFAQAQRMVAEQNWRAAQRKQQEIADQLEQRREEFAQLNEKLTEYTHLQSEYEQTKRLCDVLDERIKELNISEEAGVMNISILEVARPADEPFEPQRAKVLALATGLGILLGAGLAFLRQLLDQRLKSVEHVTALLGLPVLGVIPAMSRRENPSVRGQITCLDSQGHAAEAYRTVRTAVFFGAPKTEAKTILVTSATPGEGKSTTASNLAIAMAQAGQRVLLVDADFRRPMQNTIFQLNHEDLGLSSVLAECVELEEAIKPTDIENLDVLTCGPHVSNPSELLNSGGFAEVLDRLAERYDRVLLDSPPVGPVTDAQILAGICQVTILVLNTEKSRRNAVSHAYESLRAVNAHVMGVIVNQVHGRNGKYGYYAGRKGYGDYYGTGDHGEPSRPGNPSRGKGRASLLLANSRS